MTSLHVTDYLAGHATYPGDCTHIVGEVKGPSTLGQWRVATAADYDPVSDRTRVTFNVLEERDDATLARVQRAREDGSE